jgi:hypothetical protein
LAQNRPTLEALGAILSIIVIPRVPAMPDYHRDFLPGGSFFFTVNLLERRGDLLTREPLAKG